MTRQNNFDRKIIEILTKGRDPIFVPNPECRSLTISSFWWMKQKLFILVKLLILFAHRGTDQDLGRIF